jgi:hypothetical protein
MTILFVYSCRNPAIFRFRYSSTIYNKDDRDYRVPTNDITFMVYVMGR